jgi:cytochrome c-type biogenesis protein CcmH/NrfG
MSAAEVNWLPPIAVLAVGLVLGLLLMWRLRPGTRAAGETPESDDVARRDLEAQRDALIGELRELELTAPKARADEVARARHALEIEAARVLMELDRLADARAAQAKRAKAKGDGPAGAAPAGGSTLKGFLWGIGAVGALGLLVYLASSAAQKRAPGEGPLPPGADSQASPADGEAARLRAVVEKNPEDLEARLALAHHFLVHNDMMAVFAETRAILERRPDDPRALTYQAVVRLAMGQAQMAEEMLKRAIATQPNLEDAHVYLMLVYTETGRTAEADKALAQAVRQLPSEEAPLREILARMRAEVAERGEMPAETGPNPHEALEASVSPAPAAAPRAVDAGAGISGVIDLDASVASRPPATAVLWVLLRPAGRHSGPPLAVKRLPASFPQAFTIGAADSMTGEALPKSVSIEARVDADGDAATRDPGDPIAAADNVATGATNLRLRLAPRQ